MARPLKKGVDYFSHDTNIAGKTIYTLEQLFGNDGYAFWFKLLEILGQQEGLFYDCSIPSNWIFLTAKAKICEEKATEIIKILVDLEAIDRELWEKKKIIWSDNFVSRVKDVFAKRGTEIPVKPSFCDRNARISVVSDNKSTQSKVKESKVNKSKEKQSGENTTARSIFIPPTLEEIKEYAKQRNSLVNAKQFYDYFTAGNWIDSKGQKVRNWKQKFITWEKQEKPKNKTTGESDLILAARRLGVMQ